MTFLLRPRRGWASIMMANPEFEKPPNLVGRHLFFHPSLHILAGIIWHWHWFPEICTCEKPWLGSWILYPFASEGIWVQYPARNHCVATYARADQTWFVYAQRSQSCQQIRAAEDFRDDQRDQLKRPQQTAMNRSKLEQMDGDVIIKQLGHYVSIYMTMQKLSTLRCDIVELRNAAERRYTMIYS